MQNAILSYEPRIYTGELLYSIASRQVLLHLSPSVSSGIEWITGSKHAQLDALLPSYLARLGDQIDVDPSILRLQHTLFPYFSHFASPQSRKKAIELLMKSDSRAAFKVLGLLASRLNEFVYLKFCPTCVTQQFKRYGEAFWQCHHQLPLAIMCPEHGCYLNVCERQRKRLVFPNHSAPASLCADKAAINLVFFSRFLLTAKPTDTHQLTLCYRIRLIQKALATPSTVFIQKLRKEIRAYFSSINLPYTVENMLLDESEHGFPANMFHRPSGNHYPDKHVLMLSFLFDDVDDFKRNYAIACQERLFALAPPVPLTQVCIDEERRRAVISGLKQGYSLREIIRKANVSAATARNIADEEGLYLQRRARKVDKSSYKKIFDALKTGNHVAMISKELNVTNSDVEQVLSGHQNVKLLRRNIRFFERRSLAREAIKHVLDNKAVEAIKDLKFNYGRDYMWLFKNDKDWLLNMTAQLKIRK